jgi:hypothetical protein
VRTFTDPEKGPFPCSPEEDAWFVPAYNLINGTDEPQNVTDQHNARLESYVKKHNTTPYWWVKGLEIVSHCPRALDCPDWRYDDEEEPYSKMVKVLASLSKVVDLSKIAIGFETLGGDVQVQMEANEDSALPWTSANTSEMTEGTYYHDCTQNMSLENYKDQKRCAQPLLSQVWGPKFSATDIIGLEAAVCSKLGKNLAGVGLFTIDGVLNVGEGKRPRMWAKALCQLNETYQLPCKGKNCSCSSLTLNTTPMTGTAWCPARPVVNANADHWLVTIVATLVAVVVLLALIGFRHYHRLCATSGSKDQDHPLLPASNSHLAVRGSDVQEAILDTLSTSSHNTSSYESRWPESTSRTSDQITRALVLERLRNGIDFAVEFDEIKYREVLGSGAGGCVNAATYYGADVAVKTLFIKNNPQAQAVSQIPYACVNFVVTYTSFKAIHREAGILAAMHHPSIVTLIGFSTSPRGEVLLVTELCDTDLMQLLECWTQNRGCNDPAAAVHLGKQVASAMSFLHLKGIIHGDIKVCAALPLRHVTPIHVPYSHMYFADHTAPEHFGERPGSAAHLQAL